MYAFSGTRVVLTLEEHGNAGSSKGPAEKLPPFLSALPLFARFLLG